MVVGLPGMLVSLASLRVNEPVRGINDLEVEGSEGRASSINNNTNANTNDDTGVGISASTSRRHESAQHTVIGVSYGGVVDQASVLVAESLMILSNPHFFFALGGLCANNYAVG